MPKLGYVGRAALPYKPGYIFQSIFAIPCIIFALLVSLPPSRNSDPGSHSKLSSPPTHYGLCLPFFYRKKLSALSSLVNSRQIGLTHARRSQQFILFFLITIFANKFKISPRRDSNSRINTSSIQGLPLVHRGDRHVPYKTQVWKQ